MFARTTAAVQTAHQLDLSPVRPASADNAGHGWDDGAGASVGVPSGRGGDRSW